MFSVRLSEISLPASERDLDNLVGWFIETLCLVRKRGEATADFGRAGPVHRLLKEYLFAQPEISWDAKMLAEELALTPASQLNDTQKELQATARRFALDEMIPVVR